MSAQPTTKTFGKSTREVPASSEKAKKWYPADDEPEAKKVSPCDASLCALMYQPDGRDWTLRVYGGKIFVDNQTEFVAIRQTAQRDQSSNFTIHPSNQNIERHSHLEWIRKKEIPSWIHTRPGIITKQLC